MDVKTRVSKGIAGILSLGRRTKAARRDALGQWYYCENCSSNNGKGTETWHTFSTEGNCDVFRCEVCGNIKRVVVR